MSIVKNKDKRTGITYVYESESYWDKEKQQPRAHRTLIGKLDEETGEIIPTDGRGKKRKDQNTSQTSDTTLAKAPMESFKETIKEKDLLIRQLQAENNALKKEKSKILKDLHMLIGKYTEE
ncbi:MAG: hypothetical protein K6F00_10505 [Lachnospiraceae bacterium]|nr:hypothetical protein [Lachnospiraceae bacterium]